MGSVFRNLSGKGRAGARKETWGLHICSHCYKILQTLPITQPFIKDTSVLWLRSERLQVAHGFDCLKQLSLFLEILKVWWKLQNSVFYTRIYTQRSEWFYYVWMRWKRKTVLEVFFFRLLWWLVLTLHSGHLLIISWTTTCSKCAWTKTSVLYILVIEGFIFDW